MQSAKAPLVHRCISVLRRVLWFAINPVQKLRFRRGNDLRLHVGCSAHRLEGYVNIDVRYTWATDVTMDLNNFRWPEGRVACIYSNAFFEHLPREQRIPHLRAVLKSLRTDGGFLCYTGIPYFRNIARFYLERERGIHNQPLFDLYNVYRYTHGDPERMEKEGWYHEQLHKSLFDEDELARLLEGAGIESFVVFQHAHPHDPNPLPVNIGFYATTNSTCKEELHRECRSFLETMPHYLTMDSLQFVEPSIHRAFYQV